MSVMPDGNCRLTVLVLRGYVAGRLEPLLDRVSGQSVRLQISLSVSWSRNFMRLTLPIMSMVISFYMLAESFSRTVTYPYQFLDRHSRHGGEFCMEINKLSTFLFRFSLGINS
jgi:hypothetical protein